jgi:hypothetical protein
MGFLPFELNEPHLPFFPFLQWESIKAIHFDLGFTDPNKRRDEFLCLKPMNGTTKTVP